jgi:hypothetical protein
MDRVLRYLGKSEEMQPLMVKQQNLKSKYSSFGEVCDKPLLTAHWLKSRADLESCVDVFPDYSLPRSIVVNIVDFLDSESKQRCSSVCKELRRITAFTNKEKAVRQIDLNRLVASLRPVNTLQNAVEEEAEREVSVGESSSLLSLEDEPCNRSQGMIAALLLALILAIFEICGLFMIQSIPFKTSIGLVLVVTILFAGYAWQRMQGRDLVDSIANEAVAVTNVSLENIV